MLSTIRIIWDVKELLCLITCLVLWFGCVMYVLFNQYCRPPECDQSPYYGTIGLSFLSSFTILTTANFPDVMMSAYTYNRLFAIPFVLFLLFVSREAPRCLYCHGHARNVTECRPVLASLSIMVDGWDQAFHPIMVERLIPAVRAAQGLFFVMNIVLASVYSNYKRGLDLRASQFQDARHKSLDIAYDILTKHNLHHAKREVSHDRLQTTVLTGLWLSE